METKYELRRVEPDHTRCILSVSDETAMREIHAFIMANRESKNPDSPVTFALVAITDGDERILEEDWRLSYPNHTHNRCTPDSCRLVNESGDHTSFCTGGAAHE